MAGDAPRERDDVDAVLRFIGPGPCVVFVVDDPLQAVHGRFVEFLCDEIPSKGPGRRQADAHVDERESGKLP